MLFCLECRQFSEVKLSHDLSCPGCGSNRTAEYDSHKYAEYWKKFTEAENFWRDSSLTWTDAPKPWNRLKILRSIPDLEFCTNLGIAIRNPYNENRIKSH